MTVETNYAIEIAALRDYLEKSQGDIFQVVPSDFMKRYSNLFFLCSMAHLSLHSSLPDE